MNNQWIITISRVFCTGRAEAAKKLAETLNFDYLDKILIDETARLNFKKAFQSALHILFILRYTMLQIFLSLIFSLMSVRNTR